MCIDCGCAQDHSHDHKHDHEHESVKTISIGENLLAKNDRLAATNRELFNRSALLVLNLVSSPGSGKTTLLEKTLTELKGRFTFAVLEGDQQTANDADRIAATGAPVHQINTGAGCHLDAHMVGHGIEHFDLDKTDILMIENVGNLVCPASFDLGEDLKIAVLSTTEGEDKPAKYPHMFRAAEVMIINKTDLLPHLDFDMAKCREYALKVNPDLTIIELSCRSGEGLEQWYQWLEEQVKNKKSLTESR